MKLSRRRLAEYIVDGLASHRTERINEAAAWLVTSRRNHEAPLLARDVASILATRGYLSATFVTARKISSETISAVTSYLRLVTQAREIELTTVVDPSLVGGLKIVLPDGELDASVSSKLRTFVMEMN